MIFLDKDVGKSDLVGFSRRDLFAAQDDASRLMSADDIDECVANDGWKYSSKIDFVQRTLMLQRLAKLFFALTNRFLCLNLFGDISNQP